MLHFQYHGWHGNSFALAHDQPESLNMMPSFLGDFELEALGFNEQKHRVSSAEVVQCVHMHW